MKRINESTIKKVFYLIVTIYVLAQIMIIGTVTKVDEEEFYDFAKKYNPSQYLYPPVYLGSLHLWLLFIDSASFASLFSILCSSISAIFAYQLAKNIGGEKVARLTVILLLFEPLFTHNFNIIRPEPVLTLFSTLTFYFSYEKRKFLPFVQTDGTKNNTTYSASKPYAQTRLKNGSSRETDLILTKNQNNVRLIKTFSVPVTPQRSTLVKWSPWSLVFL